MCNKILRTELIKEAEAEGLEVQECMRRRLADEPDLVIIDDVKRKDV